ncbi:MAG: methylenetetrahydrofolate reductase [NAD(P)H] [Planctomicrobium sp.]|nr:methylenetetrahydrofolate reductase [NAD(P)H] [Planctomicrobium sp.]
MRIKEIYASKPFGFSFEIFPPKTEKGDESLLEHLSRLAERKPDFISCTYGAGGTTRDRTIELCSMIQTKFNIPATAHFTCVGSTREELCNWLDKANENGVNNIMALRGDAPDGMETFEAVDGGLRYANELVELIREKHPDFGIGVAGYPEKHPEAPDAATDLANLVRKVQAGADAIYTQLFYDNQSFFRFRDQLDQAGVAIPLIAGIMPITEFARIKRITSMCGAIIPDELSNKLEAVQDDKDAQMEIGVQFAIEQCQELIDSGVRGTHFYVLNKSEACEKILDSLQLP